MWVHKFQPKRDPKARAAALACNWDFAKDESGSDDESGGGGLFAEDPAVAFAKRAMGGERKRQEKLKRMRGEQDYATRLDKLSCSNCKTVQRYDEV